MTHRQTDSNFSGRMDDSTRRSSVHSPSQVGCEIDERGLAHEKSQRSFFGRKDKRLSARRNLGSEAWIKIGGLATRRCVVADISSSGARLVVDASVAVPREFELITAKGVPGRKCAIRWRNATQLGSAFV
jgi:hypothetical protein